MGTAWQKRVIRLFDRICQADFPVDAENRNSAVYGTHGHSDDGGGLYLCGIEQALQNGLTSLIATISVVGLLLLTILEIALGWNYFKLLLETVEQYIVVGVLCYTSPLAFSMGASKATTPVFRSWCRMVRVAAIAPCDECLVPAWLFNLGWPVHRHRRRLVQRQRQCVPVGCSVQWRSSKQHRSLTVISRQWD